jgi:NAD(P)-dependent dehydrogenase (short-subunit alcohol dehydrogenase family)
VQSSRAAGKEDRLGYLSPLRRGGQPEEIARAVLFLASDEASYINGHAMIIDGGQSSSLPVTRQDVGRTAV